MARIARTSASCISRLSFMRSAWQLVCCRHKGHLRQPIAFHISICAQTLQRDECSLKLLMQASLCVGECAASSATPSHCIWRTASTGNTPIFEVAHESLLTSDIWEVSVCYQHFCSFFFCAPDVNVCWMCIVFVTTAAAKHTQGLL